jgi:dTDP-4-dehydrorhamnose 3,5-epimerase
MQFRETAIRGVFIIEPERKEDERGFFARTWSPEELAQRGLDSGLAHCSVSFNPKAGTIRGMHYQIAPKQETKIVRCTQGRLFDVAIDLRPESSTFKNWTGVELSADNRLALYIPKGCAHGFQTLVDGTEVLYLISAPYDPVLGRGVRWNDQAFGVDWPLPVSCIGERDAAYPDFRE